MAWWLTVYCQKSVAQLQPSQLDAGLRDRDPAAPAGVDYYMLAEEREIDEDAVDEALERLEVARVSPAPLDVEIRYRAGEARPIVVHLWHEPERVAEELEEAIETREAPEAVVARLTACREIVGIELGFSQLEDMGLVFAYELARYLAQKGEGVFVDDEDQWYVVEDGALIEIGET